MEWNANRFRVALFYAAAFLVSAEVLAAEIVDPGIRSDATCDVDVCWYATLSGEIVEGDAERLATIIERFRSSSLESETVNLKQRLRYLYLDSPGGNLNEAMKIGRVLRKNELWTFISASDQCHSACVFVFIAGVMRAAFGEVGIHSFYSLAFSGKDAFEDIDEQYKEQTRIVRQYLDEIRIPQRLLDKIFEVPPQELRLLTVDEKLELIPSLDPAWAASQMTKRESQSKK